MSELSKVRAERDAALVQVAALRAEIVNLLASAHPHPVEHPTMTAAWQKASAALAQPFPAAELIAQKAAAFDALFTAIDRNTDAVLGRKREEEA
jgi:hypothetical protein